MTANDRLCRLMTQSGHRGVKPTNVAFAKIHNNAFGECPLSGAKRT